MSYDVHVVIVGDSPDPVFMTLRSDRPMDRLYLLCDSDDSHIDTLDRIMAGLSAVGFNDVLDVPIDPSDYNGMLADLTSLFSNEKTEHDDVVFHINFSTGNSVPVIALRHAVESYDHDLFYLRNGKPVSMGSESVEDVMDLKIQTKVLDTFLMFKDSDERTNSELRGDLSAPALSYRTKELERMGLIVSEGSYRNLTWKVTSKGKSMLRRFRN